MPSWPAYMRTPCDWTPFHTPNNVQRYPPRACSGGPHPRRPRRDPRLKYLLHRPFALLHLPREIILHITSFLAPDNLISLIQSTPHLLFLESSLLLLSRSPGVEVPRGLLSPLEYAISRRILPLATQLLQSGVPASPLAPVSDGKFRTYHPPLYIAIALSSRRLVALLLHYGADVNTRTWVVYVETPVQSRDVEWYTIRPRLVTPLEWALTMLPPSLPVIGMLLDAGANMEDAHPETGKTALLTAVWTQPIQGGLIRLLLSRGGDLTARTAKGKTALYVACTKPGFPMDLIEEMLDKGADIDAAQNNGITPVHALCLQDECPVPTLRLLLDRGADVYTQTSHLMTPLLSLCQPRHYNRGPVPPSYYEAIIMLLAAGVSIHDRGPTGRTALGGICVHATAASGPTITALLEAGSDPNAADNTAMTPLLWLCSDSDATSAMVAGLLAAGGNPRAAAPGGWLFVHGRGTQGASAAHAAVARDNAGVLKVLMEAGQDVDVRDADGAGLLHYAMVGRRADVVEVLLKRGVDRGMVTKSGQGVGSWMREGDEGPRNEKGWRGLCKRWGIKL